MSLYLGENKIADNTCSRNIGEIVASTIPLSDAGLHLLDGALISSAGSYAKFVNYIAGLVTDYPDLFVSESDWQSAVTTYGVCGKFVYDSTNNTVRLPKITGFTEGTTDVTALGDLVEAGLPNITGNMYRVFTGNQSGDGVFSATPVGLGDVGAEKWDQQTTYNFDASRSNSIYGNSTTVQPQSIKVLYYIVIASSITNELNLDVADMATKSLDNLDNTGKNIANWSNNVTNCITEIPQDIKLELNNGTLTLKAGSKVYVPNGFETDGTTPKFDIVTIENDITDVLGMTGTYNRVIHYSPSINKIQARYYSYTDVINPVTGEYFNYNTATNKVELYHTNTKDEYDYSLPLGYIHSTESVIDNINQVFNGFGYIGSTVFALPGVKGLIPNGRNADGTLKNIEVVTDRVRVETAAGTLNGSYFIRLFTDTIGVGSLTYKTDENFNYIDNIKRDIIAAGTIIADGSKITSLIPKTAFHALDYNDSSTISGWSMPSSRYIDLTLGASPARYTAPANGYFAIASTFNQNGLLFMYSDSPRYGNSYKFNANEWTEGVLFAKKGYSVTIQYSGTPSLQYFRFHYAEGEN